VKSSTTKTPAPNVDTPIPPSNKLRSMTTN
jgi:hypothetical protein